MGLHDFFLWLLLAVVILVPLGTTSYYRIMEREYEKKEQARTDRAYPVVIVYVTATAMYVPFLFLIIGQSWLMLLLYGLFCATLTLVIFFDLRYHLIPNRCVLFLLIAALGINRLQEKLGWWDTLSGFFVGGVVVGLMSMFTGGGIGVGDVKLAAALGLLFQPVQTLTLLFIACLLGSTVAVVLLATKRKGLKDAIAFGPYLAIAGWLMFVTKVWAG